MSFLSLIHCAAAMLVSALAIGASGCSDPATPPAQGAFSVEIGGSTCPIESQDSALSVGLATGTAKSTVPDGENNTSVSCIVTANGDSFAVRANIQNGGKGLFLQGTTTQAKPGTARVVIDAPSLPSSLKSTTEQPCELTLVAGASGKLWAGFRCDALALQGQSGSCAALNGWIVLENCDP